MRGRFREGANNMASLLRLRDSAPHAIAIAVILAFVLAAQVAAGSGLGGVFNLGVQNHVNATSQLVGAVAGFQLTVANASTDAAAAGIRATSKGTAATGRFANTSSGNGVTGSSNSG